MRMDKFTQLFQNALSDAQSLAVGADHTAIESVHVLKAMLQQKSGTLCALLEKIQANLSVIGNECERLLSELPRLQQPTGEVSISRNLSKILNLCDKMAQSKGDQFISCDWFPLVLLQHDQALASVLKHAGVSVKKLEEAIASVRGDQKVNDMNADSKRESLAK